ncbi:MAG: formylglycine-generating enzyme family protein [Planctomycetota bacterium]
MAERTTNATSNNINKEWERRRNQLIDKYMNSSFKNNNYHTAFQKLRNNVKETLNRLEALDNESPDGFSKELTPPKWNIKRTGLYYVKREILFKNIISKMPETEADDPNSDKFKRQWGQRIDELKDWKSELTKLISAFNEMEKALDECYLLNDTLPDSNTIGQLYASWKGKEIFKEQEIAFAIKEVADRVKKIIDIDNNSGNTLYLEKTALDSDSHPEARYAAWTKLDQLSTWPIQPKDREKEELIQSSLKKEFKIISKTNHTRGNDLQTKLADANIQRFKNILAYNTHQDKILRSFGNFRPYGPDPDLDQKVEHGTLAKNLADFVQSKQWKENKSKIAMSMFKDEKSQLYSKKTSELTSQDYKDWLDIKMYIKLENDPRQKYNNQDNNNIYSKARDVRGLITNDLRLAKIKETQEFEAEINNIEETITRIFGKDAIKKNEEEIDEDVSVLDGFWRDLETLENNIRSVIKPVYCKNVVLLGEKRPGEKRQIVFDSTVALSPDFEPVIKKNDKVFEFEPKFIDELNDFKKPGTLKDTFFDKTQGEDDDLNLGWPKYIRSKKDPSVILKFIPAGNGNTEPFYMATHEITNKQYLSFILTNNSKQLPLGGWNQIYIFPKDDPKLKKFLIRAHSDDFRPRQIMWDNDKKKFDVAKDRANCPVTYVTYTGAKSYAQWFAAQLPTPAQHEYASRAGTTTTYPWGGDPERNPNQAHVRAYAWKNTADDYDNKKAALSVTLTEDLPPKPLGAIWDSQWNSPLNVTDYVKSLKGKTTYETAWPAKSSSSPNNWGIYDLIGNVWEWCKTDIDDDKHGIICGGSCLSPTKDDKPDSKHIFTFPANGSFGVSKPVNEVLPRSVIPANDLGFRVIVPARIKQN